MTIRPPPPGRRHVPPAPALACENRRAEGTPPVGMRFARASESVFPDPRTSAPGPKGCAGGAPDVQDEEGGSGRGELAPPLLPLPLKGGGTLVLLAVALVLGFGGASPGFAAGLPGTLEEVGHDDLGARGLNSALALADHCAYVGSRGQGPILIEDIADPAHPHGVGSLPGRPLTTARELRAVPARRLLIVLSYALARGGANRLDLYRW